MKELKVEETRFLLKPDLLPEEQWIWQLSDSENNTYFIMDLPFYRLQNLTNPVHKGHVDSLRDGDLVKAQVKKIDGKLIITELL